MLFRSDRSKDQFYNHDDKDAEKKKTQYSTFEDVGKFTGFTTDYTGDSLAVTANYKLGCLDQVVWKIAPNGTASVDVAYNFHGVVDLMGIMFDYPEEKVESKKWVGAGPYRVWQNRIHGPQLGVWENDYNDPIPGESFTYPEFKGYFADVQWMQLKTKQGTINLINETPDAYVGVYQPRDGRDELLYRLPSTGISMMKVIPMIVINVLTQKVYQGLAMVLLLYVILILVMVEQEKPKPEVQENLHHLEMMQQLPRVTMSIKLEGNLISVLNTMKVKSLLDIR